MYMRICTPPARGAKTDVIVRSNDIDVKKAKTSSSDLIYVSVAYSI